MLLASRVATRPEKCGTKLFRFGVLISTSFASPCAKARRQRETASVSSRVVAQTASLQRWAAFSTSEIEPVPPEDLDSGHLRLLVVDKACSVVLS